MRVGVPGLVIVVFQELEVVDLLEWVEGEAKQYFVRVYLHFLYYQMATKKTLPVCF